MTSCEDNQLMGLIWPGFTCMVNVSGLHGLFRVVNKQHRSNSRHRMSDQPDRHRSIPFKHAHSDQSRHDWAVDLTQESPRLSGRRNNISLASATTNWETHLSVRLHSHRSAAWKPGQNHDYQLHSSPNPVGRNREENNRLDEQKKSPS